MGHKTYDIWDLINNDHYDILVLAEIWLGSLDNTKNPEMAPVMHTFLGGENIERV